MTFGTAFIDELVKIAEGDTPEEIGRLCRQLGLRESSDRARALFRNLAGTDEPLSRMNDAQLNAVIRGLQTLLAKRRSRPLPKMPKIPKSKQVKSDLVRAADRKKMLLGVKREKAILKVDIMKRIRKKQRLALRPFRGLKKKQRQMRLGLVRNNRKQARRGYGR